MLHLAPSGQAEDVCVDAIRIMDHKPALQDGRDLHLKAEQFPGDGEANALLTKKHRPPWGFNS